MNTNKIKFEKKKKEIKNLKMKNKKKIIRHV